jgi:hypothetical protein
MGNRESGPKGASERKENSVELISWLDVTRAARRWHTPLNTNPTLKFRIVRSPPFMHVSEHMMRRILTVALIALTGFLLWAGWYGQTKGFTRKWRQLVAKEFNRVGLDIRFKRLTLSPLNGFVAEDVTLTAGESRLPFATINRMTLSVDASKALRGKPFLRSLILRGAHLRMPLPPPAQATPLELRDLDANLYFPRNTLLISNASASVHNVDVSLRGSLRNLDSVAPSIDPNSLAAIAGLLNVVREIEAERSPSLSLTFSGDLDQPDSIEFSATFSGSDFRFRNAPITGARADASLHRNRINLHALSVADDTGKLEAFGDWEDGRPIRVELQSTLSRKSLQATEPFVPAVAKTLLSLSPNPALSLSIAPEPEHSTFPILSGRASFPATRLPGTRQGDLAFTFAISPEKTAIHDGRFTTKEEQFSFAFLKEGDSCHSDVPTPLPLSLRLLFEAVGLKPR